MRRRVFIAGLGGAAAGPLTARAQQGEPVRRIGVLMGGDETDPSLKLRLSVFRQALADLGWTDGQNVGMYVLWAAADVDRMQAHAKELVGLQPDIILATSTPTTLAVQRETRAIPIVFTEVGDPVAIGLVAGLNQPGGNITGFALYEAPLGRKWLALLSEIAPRSRQPQLCSTPTPPLYRFICLHLRRPRGRSRSSQSLRPFMTT